MYAPKNEYKNKYNPHIIAPRGTLITIVIRNRIKARINDQTGFIITSPNDNTSCTS